MMPDLRSQLLETQVDAFGYMSVYANAHVCVGTNCICIDAPMRNSGKGIPLNRWDPVELYMLPIEDHWKPNKSF